MIGLILYWVFFDSIIEGLIAWIESIKDKLEQLPNTLNPVIPSRLMLVVAITLLTGILLAFSSELFAYQKAPRVGLLFLYRSFL